MNPGEPLSTRVPRMKAYNQLVEDLDSGGARYSQDLSEVDLSDLENLKVRVNDPHGDVLVELGSSDYLKRYKTFVSHVQEWRQQFQKLESVNLRYDNQVIVNPDIEGKPKQAALTAVAAKAAAAAGVRPAALITRIDPHDRTVPKPAFELTEKKLNPKAPAQKKPVQRTKVRRPVARPVAKAVAKKKEAARHAASVSKAKATATHSAVAGRNAKRPQPAAVAAIPKPNPGIAKQSTSAGSN